LELGEKPALPKGESFGSHDQGAFDALEPALRSRSAPQEQARQKYAHEGFRDEMRALFSGEATGRLVILTIEDTLERIAELEGRIARLEQERAEERLGRQPLS